MSRSNPQEDVQTAVCSAYLTGKAFGRTPVRCQPPSSPSPQPQVPAPVANRGPVSTRRKRCKRCFVFTTPESKTAAWDGSTCAGNMMDTMSYLILVKPDTTDNTEIRDIKAAQFIMAPEQPPPPRCPPCSPSPPRQRRPGARPPPPPPGQDARPAQIRTRTAWVNISERVRQIRSVFFQQRQLGHSHVQLGS